MHSRLMLMAAAFGFTAVAAGAFGAHGLRDRLAPDLLTIYQTGAHYHLIHAVALLAVALCAHRGQRALVAAAGLWAAGMVVFSGSLYTLAITGQRWLGAITPIGGLLLLAGWLAVAVAGVRAARSP